MKMLRKMSQANKPALSSRLYIIYYPYRLTVDSISLFK